MLKSQQKKTVLLRADANLHIGFGHLSRILALASFIHRDFNIILLTDCNNLDIQSEFIKLGVEINAIKTWPFYSHPDQAGNKEIPWDIPDELLRRIDIIVLDGYWFGEKYREKCKTEQKKTVVIDDFAKPINFADLIINHAPGIDYTAYHSSANCLIATGLSYALLRKEFFNKNEKLFLRDQAFVCFGGLDKGMLSSRAAQFFLTNEKLSVVNVLISRLTNPKTLHSLQELQEKNLSRLRIVKDIQAEEICDILDQSRYAIVAASTILFEAYFRGCNCICVQTSENQALIYSGFVKSSFALGIGDLESRDIFNKTDALWKDILNFQFKLDSHIYNPIQSVLSLFLQI